MAKPTMTKPEHLPAIPLRDMVCFPHMMAPFLVGRDYCMAALEQAVAARHKRLFLATQRDAKIDDPSQDDIHEIGVTARVIHHLKLPDGNVKVMVEGDQRARLKKLTRKEGALDAEIEVLEVDVTVHEELGDFVAQLLASFEQYTKVSPHLEFQGLMSSLTPDDPDRLADTIASHMKISTHEKQALLEMLSPYERLQRIYDLLHVETQKMAADQRIDARVEEQLGKDQKTHYLRQKIKAIREELGAISVHEPMLGQSRETQDVLTYAELEAAVLEHRELDPIHLLIGLLRVTDSPAARVLVDHGLDLEKIRRAARAMARDKAPAETTAGKASAARSEIVLAELAQLYRTVQKQGDELDALKAKVVEIESVLGRD